MNKHTNKTEPPKLVQPERHALQESAREEETEKVTEEESEQIIEEEEPVPGPDAPPAAGEGP